MFSKLFALVLAFLLLFSSFAQAQQERFEPGSVYLFEGYYNNNLGKLMDPNEPNGAFIFDVRSFDLDLVNEKLTLNVWSITKWPHPSSVLNLGSVSRLEIGLLHWNTILFVEMGYTEINGTVHSRKAYTTIYGRKMDQSGNSSFQLLQKRTLLNSF